MTQGIKRSSDGEIKRLDSITSTIDRRVSSIKGNNERRHEVVLQRFDRTDGLLQQLVKTPYRVVGRGGTQVKQTLCLIMMIVHYG